MKTCVSCNKTESKPQWYAGPKCASCYKRDLILKNPTKAKEINLRANKKAKARQKDWHLKRKYGISLSEFKDLMLKQGGVCAICYQPEVGQALSVDHSHKTGKIRGLLCDTCNTTLGKFKDNADRFISAAVYLAKNTTNET